MNSFSLIVLVMLNFVAIGLLPILFFRGDGQFNLRWFATGAPFFVVPAAVLLWQFGVLEPLYHPQAQGLPVIQAVAVILSAISISLIAMTVGTHRIPLALWHQDNDAPVELVTWGPYSRIRHPFYTSFLLAFAAAVFAFPHAITVGCLAYGLAVLTITARREERRLSTSSLGAEYRQYMSDAGRFFPRIMS
jgi:protein-S-isoprenylcysteine O-methyltransferase Ste14